MHEQEVNWMPMQSNPEVINNFIEKMGMSHQQFTFQEMLATEEWALEMIAKPVIGILFLYEQTPVQLDYKEIQAASLDPQNVPNNVFYMKQKAKNACGTIALFHIVLNAVEKYPDLVTPGSFLDNFRQSAANASPSERADLFKNNNQILNQHKNSVAQGQSSVQMNCDSHFIAFVHKNGAIYELDGFKKCAVNHGECSEDEFLPKGAEIIQQFMARDPENLTFSMIVLAAHPQ